MPYKIYETEVFSRIYEDLPGNEKQWIDNIKIKLKTNPTGKILKFSWFREKKYLNKRLYFIVDEKTKNILLISFASKKNQKRLINFVKGNINELLKSIKAKQLS